LARIPSGDSHDGSACYFNEATRFYQKTYDALRRGLGDRAKLIYLQCCQTPSWGSSECPPSRNIDLLVGLILNPEKCWRSLDHGPPAENLAASQEFRKFWGDKAELRRFKDGSILECVVWNPRDPKQSILDQIIIYVLRPHTPVILGSAFNQLVPRPNSDASNPTTPFLPIITTFESLAKKIRSLERLPLQIRQITAACPELCFASLGIPNLDPTVNDTKPVDVIIQFEGSARWPGGIVAVQRTKIAFLLKLGELLEEGTPGLTTKLGLENENNELLNQSFLDVFDPIGAVFRLRIHHERELSILQQEMKNESSTFRRLNMGSAISTYKRDFIERPRHTEMVHMLSTRFPLLSPTIRLMKKWRDSHLLSGHIGDELVELLTMRTFVHPHPWPIPGSITTGFLRTLAWLASWDWRVEPLIIDFHHEMSAQDIADVNLKYKAWRKIDPVMNRITTFVASNLDRDGVTWTEQGPSKVATARLFSLAVSADGLAKKQGLSLRAEALFATPRADYDFVIHLNPDYVHGSSAQARRRQSFKNLTLQRDSMISPGDTPVQAFLAEVRKMYGSNILFFHNAHETLFIAGIWNPQTGIRNWKGNLGYSSMPVLESGSDPIKIAINSMATLHDLARLGGSLVSKIDLK
jgi:U3 small nucleolar RNA-associated protein 22